MKLLLDANISWRLVERLKPYFKDCFHVEKVALPIPSKDAEIWQYALEHEIIIVTNDDDFLDYAHIKGFPPNFFLLRTGNQSSDYILSLLIRHKEDIALLHSSPETGLLEVF